MEPRLLNREDFAQAEAAALNLLVCIAWNRHDGPFQEKAATSAARNLKAEINKLAALRSDRAAALALLAEGTTEKAA